MGPDTFNIYLIPETRRATNLGRILPGDSVNLEIEAQTQVAFMVESMKGPMYSYGHAPSDTFENTHAEQEGGQYASSSAVLWRHHSRMDCSAFLGYNITCLLIDVKFTKAGMKKCILARRMLLHSLLFIGRILCACRQ